jgi:hypothetical protein
MDFTARRCHDPAMRNLAVLLLALQLMLSPAFADFQDRGMVAGAARTDLAPGKGTGSDLLALRYSNPAPDGCLFSVLDPLNNIFGCPGLVRVRDKANGQPGWAGLQVHPTCGSSDTAVGPAATPVGDSWLGCLSYAGSPFFSLNTPGSQYWVIVANSDPAFDQCNDGPPGLSHTIRNPIVDPKPALYKVAMEDLPSGARRAHLILNASNHPFRCDRPGDRQGPHPVIPFLSLGAHRGHGQAGPVTTMNRSFLAGAQPRVEWVSRIWDYVPFGCDPAKGKEPCFAQGVTAGFYAIASWDGVKHLLFVHQLGEDQLDFNAVPPARSHWNWPVQESFYYPGAEVAAFANGHVAASCGLNLPRLAVDGRWLQYSVDITRLFGCASDLNLFSSPMPAAQDVALDGFHWYIEAVGSSGALWLSIENPQVN